MNKGMMPRAMNRSGMKMYCMVTFLADGERLP